MATTREIQLRIRSIKGTQQITRAMKLVSTAKLQKIRAIAQSNTPYFQAVYQTMCSILALTGDDVLNGPMLQSGKSAYLVITSDRGLAGGYNANVCKLLERSMGSKEDALILTVGRRGREYFSRRGFTLGQHFETPAEVPEYSGVRQIQDAVMDLYRSGTVKEIYVAYTSFQNTLSQTATLMKLFPLQREDFMGGEDEQESKHGTMPHVLMNFEPGPEAVLANIIPRYMGGILYGVLVESSASEQGARMTAMDSATENAQDICDKLTLQYNRARQGHITQEITEIVNGASALEG
ncbi:ATP synthase F1 subunit gamma [Bianquea renquensis]|uniref:ATP synthase gamma chain n=1 Tax=Bianquea renquensis TaxID=2763661 RepID=A0A926DRD9_9FIRM|nr:ATP synthase F1 subunit gamma [Bianquea renquensis]MBC8542653.1 ATP synthase F1 subunit gamma [Bianquea renquensis]